jgi:hypothetical protein
VAGALATANYQRLIGLRYAYLLQTKCPRPESNQCTRFRKSRASGRTRASVAAESVVSGLECARCTSESAV